LVNKFPVEHVSTGFFLTNYKRRHTIDSDNSLLMEALPYAKGIEISVWQYAPIHEQFPFLSEWKTGDGSEEKTVTRGLLLTLSPDGCN